MKIYSTQARELLTNSEMSEVKGGFTSSTSDNGTCDVSCRSCATGCSTCATCAKSPDTTVRK